MSALLLAAARGEWSTFPTTCSPHDLVLSDSLGRCVLHWAAAGSPRALAQKLFLAVASVGAGASVTQSGETPLHWLVDSSRLLDDADADVVFAALKAGIDPARRSEATGLSAADALRARLAVAAPDAAAAARCLAVIDAALEGGWRHNMSGEQQALVPVAAAAPAAASGKKKLQIKLKT